MHKIAIPQYIIDRVVKARGSMHAFDRFLGPSTALLVVDLQNTFMLPPYPTEVPLAREIVPNVNRLAAATRGAGGLVAWIQMTHQEEDQRSWSVFYDHVSNSANRSEGLKRLGRGTHAAQRRDALDCPAQCRARRRAHAYFRGIAAQSAMNGNSCWRQAEVIRTKLGSGPRRETAAGRGSRPASRAGHPVVICRH